jgi:hypothetical protein
LNIFMKKVIIIVKQRFYFLRFSEKIFKIILL